MEKLEKVIAGLEHCRDKDRGCEGCPYFECDDCENRLYQDTVEWTTVLKGTKLYMAREYRKLEEKLAAVEAERDDLRKDIEAQGEIILELNRDLKRCREALNAQGEYKYLGGDLISREALIERIENVDWYHQTECGTSTVMWQGASSEEEAWFKAPDIFATVREVPAAESEPVVHAHWEQYTDDDENWGDLPYFKCSACGTVELTGRKRCPECGAHMDEEVAE